MIVNERIQKIREKLNKAIEENKEFDEIYKLSTELDELIVEYYKQKID